jgi:hypothetical protein
MSRRALLISCAFLASACYLDFDAETTGFDSYSAANVARQVEDDFLRLVTNRASLDVSCPAGLTGQGGNKFMCQGETSDGYLVDVAILERGGGAYRWDIVASRPVAARLARLVEDEVVKVVTDGTSVDVSCPAGITGQRGNKFMCQGETSDGYLFDVAVLERGGEAYRWEIVERRPVR